MPPQVPPGDPDLGRHYIAVADAFDRRADSWPATELDHTRHFREEARRLRLLANPLLAPPAPPASLLGKAPRGGT